MARGRIWYYDQFPITLRQKEPNLSFFLSNSYSGFLKFLGGMEIENWSKIGYYGWKC